MSCRQMQIAAQLFFPSTMHGLGKVYGLKSEVHSAPQCNRFRVKADGPSEASEGRRDLFPRTHEQPCRRPSGAVGRRKRNCQDDLRHESRNWAAWVVDLSWSRSLVLRCQRLVQHTAVVIEVCSLCSIVPHSRTCVRGPLDSKTIQIVAPLLGET